MGNEYYIRHIPKDRAVWDAFIEGLSNPADTSGWRAFTAKITERGIYFCDHSRSEAAAVAFRRIVDRSLTEGTSVVIEEAG